MNLSKSEGSRILKKLEKISDYHAKADKDAHDIKDILSNATASAPPGRSSGGGGGTSRRRAGTPRGRKLKPDPRGGGGDDGSGSESD